MLPVRSITNAYFIFNEECFSVIKGEEEMEEEEKERQEITEWKRWRFIPWWSLAALQPGPSVKEHQRRNLPGT